MRTYSLILDNIVREHLFTNSIPFSDEAAANFIFDFDYPFPPDYKCEFQIKFFRRYRFLNINYDSYGMWREILKSKLYELMPYYFKLYASENLISNPFVNYAFQMDNWSRNRGRDINYETRNHKEITETQNNSAGDNIQRGIDTTGESGADISKIESVLKNKGMEDSNSNNWNKFSDTPSSAVEDETLFNDGYLTTFDRSNERTAKIQSGVNTNDERNSNQHTVFKSSDTENITTSVNQNQGLQENQKYDDNNSVGSSESTEKRINNEYGLKGVTLASALIEWRLTFINIDKMLLDELNVLFMKVY